MKHLVKVYSRLKSRGGMREIVVALVVLAFFAFVFSFIPLQVPPPLSEGDPLARSPRFFPYLVTIPAIILSLVLLIQSFARPSGVVEGGKGILGVEQVLRITPVVVIAVIYLFLFNLLGYMVSAMLGFVAFMWYYGISFRKEWKVAIPVGILLPALTYYIFKYWLYVPLPAGILRLIGLY